MPIAWKYGFHSLVLILRVELLNHEGLLFFNFLRTVHTVSHNECMNLHSYQQGCMGSFFSPTSSPTLVIFYIFGNNDFNWLRYYLIVVLIWTSLMISNLGPFFQTPFGQFYVFFWEVSIGPFSCLWNWFIWEFFVTELCELLMWLGYESYQT